MITCKAAIALGDGTFCIDKINILPPQSDEVIVKIMAAGLCHTDHDSLNWGKPIIMGHEGAGIVAYVGNKVTTFKKGDSVILNWATPCMKCFQCTRGNQNICENNSPVVAGGEGYNSGHATPGGTTWKNKSIERSFNIGTLSEYTLVKASALVKINSNKLSYASASIISCGVMTGYGSVVNVAKVKTGDTVVVLGTGGVGLNVIQGSKISKASKIIAIDINQNRLELAKQFGATHTILADKEDKGLLIAAAKVKSLTNNRGADFAFECTAIPALGAAPLAMIRNAGTAVQVSGIEENISFDMNLFEWDKIYINPLYGKCNPEKDFPALVNLYNNGDLLLDEMITNTYTLEQLQDAFDDMMTGKNAKGVITFKKEIDDLHYPISIEPKRSSKHSQDTPQIKVAIGTKEISNPLYENSNLRFITIKSDNLKGRGDICVFVPRGNTDLDLPITILLHGVYGSSWSWAMSGGVHHTAQELIDSGQLSPMVIIMPSDGLWGDGSAYMNHSEKDFESWIIKDVINATKELIPQVEKSNKTFISGLSMGGFGALRMGVKCGHMFEAISVHSSLTELSQMSLFVSEDLDHYRQEDERDESILKTILNYNNNIPPLRFDCGKNDLLVQHNRDLANELKKINIPFIYEEFEGEHNWEYWQEHIVDSLLFFNKHINK